jgi:Arc/MetJ-type ribon-helix-helix transcriptional regulator
MSRQIAVRLPDDIVDFVDVLVREGKANSRAIVVTRALEGERRRTVAAQGAAVLARADRDIDMDSLAEHIAHVPFDLSSATFHSAQLDKARPVLCPISLFATPRVT